MQCLLASQSPAATAARLPSLYQFFGPGGVLARTHPAYEFRRGQLQMAEAVEQALEERRHLIVEAGTGTGKTLAYLLPVIRSGKRVIISTGTKTLQEQLFFKDVPFLKEHLGELRVCYMKGRGNYLCRKKLYDLTAQPMLNGLEEINQFRIISDWEKTTETGDRAELAELPETSHLWPKLDARTERCIGSDCQQFDRCFITEMRRRAAESDIIIVNHHLFFADLAIKAATDRAPDAGVLPDAGVVIFDEAHELEDVAADYFGVTVSNLRIDELLRDVENTLRRAAVPFANVLSASARVREHSQFFFSLIPPGEGRFAFENRAEFLEENGDEYLGLQNSLTHLYTELQAIPNKPDEVHALSRRVDELRMQLGFVMEAQGAQHRVLDRAPGRWPRRVLAAPRRAAQRLSAGHAHHRLRHSAHHALRASGVGGAHLGHARGLRRLRIHAQPAWHPARARTRRALALRLREPGAALRSARHARPARSALRRAAHRSACGSCWRSPADAPSACSPATP